MQIDPHTPLCKCPPQDCWGVEVSGALSYSAGLSLLQESPSTCLHGSLTFNTVISCWNFTLVCLLRLAVQNTERQVCTFWFKVQITLMAELIWTLQHTWFFTSFCLGMPCKHIFPWAPCVPRELWHYLLRRSPCCSSMCLCFDLDNSWANMGSRHWPEDHQNKGSLQLHRKHSGTDTQWNFGLKWRVDSHRWIQISSPDSGLHQERLKKLFSTLSNGCLKCIFEEWPLNLTP